MLYENHLFFVKASIRRFLPAKMAECVSEKPCRTNELYENSEMDDFRTRLPETMKFFARMSDIPQNRR